GIEIPAIHYLWNYPPRQIFTPAKLKKCVALVGFSTIGGKHGTTSTSLITDSRKTITIKAC
ncbi:hypothetical protein KX252_22315, partial [Escherichia coli]